MELNSILSSIKNSASISSSPIPAGSSSSLTKKPSPTRAPHNGSGSGTSSKSIPELDSIISGMKATLLSGSSVASEEEVVGESVSTPMPDPAGAGSEEDDPILAAQPVKASQPSLSNASEEASSAPAESVAKPELKALADIVIDLDSIQPSREPSRTVLDDKEGLQITLNFAADHPRPDVTVIVISTINQGRTSIPSFQFDASVRKPCKLRLLPPSATSLPGTKPFRPPADGITQVLLLANPTGEPVDVTCILTYLVGDDPDPIKESIVMQAVPSVGE
uniref:GAE domain-containing protein n=1 Tax=Anopheles maculatus TaxID=74869 RepID=A0A182T855_9DIPT